MRFNDNTQTPIIAFDFDGVLAVDSEGTSYPIPHKLRKHASRVTNFMHELGIKVIVWTCRECAEINGHKHDHVEPMERFLKDNNVYYDSINDSSEFAPYTYNPRKIYAHMYVDDRGYGWDGDDEDVLLNILREFLVRVCGFSHSSAGFTTACCCYNQDPEDWMIEGVKNFKIDRSYNKIIPRKEEQQ